MEIDPGTVSIIQLGWSRLLKLDDTAFADAAGERLHRRDDDAEVLTFVRLFGQEALVGPGWAIDAATGFDGEVLARHSTLLRLTRDHGGRGLGEANLFFCDSLPTLEHRDDGAVSDEPAFALELERLCPPDDTAEVGLSSLEHQSILVDDSNTPPLPFAGAGYDIWGGILAHLGVLTAPDRRGQGHATFIAKVAVEDAMAAGLIPQWRARTDNTASIRTALRAGFIGCGSQTSVLLPGRG
ncbi:GNAT family N-acetyltransferase [Arthrobacter sp. H20]|uniref:GNAT family N-acetyltransferase n=1 Tax=Arthrobacter sp. H20 TaxID=1267981 RepID=UPI00047C71CE|nr:GNAT family N-acetyltransferase [Arthrobacter sp. H20]